MQENMRAALEQNSQMPPEMRDNIMKWLSGPNIGLIIAAVDVADLRGLRDARVAAGPRVLPQEDAARRAADDARVSPKRPWIEA